MTVDPSLTPSVSLPCPSVTEPRLYFVRAQDSTVSGQSLPRTEGKDSSDLHFKCVPDSTVLRVGHMPVDLFGSKNNYSRNGVGVRTASPSLKCSSIQEYCRLRSPRISSVFSSLLFVGKGSVGVGPLSVYSSGTSVTEV